MSDNETAIRAEAEQIQRRILTLDTHVDIEGSDYATKKLDPGIDNPKLRCDLVKMAKGGVDAVFLVVYTGQGKRDEAGYRKAYNNAVGKFDAIHRLTETMYPDRCALATSPAQVRAIVASGKRAFCIGVENAYPIGEQLGRVEEFYKRGARYMSLTHNGHNQLADSCIGLPSLHDKPSEHNGLSPFGRQVVAEMNRLGMMVDVSHVGKKSFWDILALSKAPIIASHSGCGGLNDHSRNLDDRQLKALASKGGVLQIVGYGEYLKGPSAQHRQAVKQLSKQLDFQLVHGYPVGKDLTKEKTDRIWNELGKIDRRYPAATVKEYVDHIDYVKHLVGIEHVGIGSDFDGGGGLPGFENHAEALNVTIELVRRGYTEQEIRCIWGENLLRVWSDVEKVAAKIAAKTKKN